MQDKDVNKYLEAYYENEYDANKHMTFALLFSAILLFLIWIGYITNLFALSLQTRILVNITFPLSILILIIPLFLIKTKYIMTSS